MSEVPISPLQAMVDGMSAAWQKGRAQSQMTLGGLIEALGQLPKGSTISGFGHPQSYRGYYCDLSFTPESREEPVADLLSRCRESMGQTFTGYKGGEYVMGESTPVWIAEYGSCGRKLMSLNTGGSPVVPVTAEDE